MYCSSLTAVAHDVVRWAYGTVSVVPHFVDAKDRDVVRSRSEFRKAVNDSVGSNGPFRPLKLIKHAIQSFYSETKGGVNGASQQRAILRSSTFHLQWKQKMVTQVLKTVTLNELFSWRIFTRRDLLQSAEDFESLESF